VTNVGNYIIGRSKGETARKMVEENPLLAKKDLQTLPDLSFYQIQLSRRPIKSKIEYIGSKYSVTKKVWKKALKQQLGLYYRDALPYLENEREHNNLLASSESKMQAHNTARKPLRPAPDFSKKLNPKPPHE